MTSQPRHTPRHGNIRTECHLNKGVDDIPFFCSDILNLLGLHLDPSSIMMESVWLSLMLAINLGSILSVHPNVYIFYIPLDLLLLQFITS